MSEGDDEGIPDRKMNDSTIPPPKSRFLVGASPGELLLSTTTSNNAPTFTSSMPPPALRYTAKPAVPRRKRGFGLSDWNRLVASSKDLALRQGAPLRKIRWKEIRQHNSPHDGWVVLKGKVYFVSPYLAYHPGGERILQQVLGKDVSTLYDKYHQWVNEDGYVRERYYCELSALNAMSA
jgi:hypothetical protein